MDAFFESNPHMEVAIARAKAWRPSYAESTRARMASYGPEWVPTEHDERVIELAEELDRRVWEQVQAQHTGPNGKASAHFVYPHP